MKILLVTHIFPPAIDGGSKIIYKLGKYLQNQNHEVMVLTSNCTSTDDFINPHSNPVDLQSCNCDLKSTQRVSVHKILRRPLKLICLFIPKNSYIRQLLDIFQKGPIFKIFPFVRSLLKIIEFKPDFIITGPFPTTIALYATLIKKVCKSKILIAPCFHQTDNDFQKKPLVTCLKSADFIWSLSQYEKKYFIKNFNIDQNKILVARCGIDNNFLISENKIKFPKFSNILFIGSLASHKKVDLLIESFLEICKSQINVSLTIAGQKTLFYPTLQRQIKNFDQKTKKKIKFIFNPSDKKIKQLIDKSTVLILPSIQESFGLVLIEAMGRGKPVITSEIPPTKELIAYTKGGLIFKTNLKTDLIQKIKTIINNKKLAQELGSEGYQSVSKNFTWDKIGNQICKKIFS